MKKTIVALTLIVSTLLSNVAQAYDIDTHFYATSLMLIFCGVKPAIAFKIAAAAQWIDESPMTTPMLGERQRRLFHFPQELTDTQLPLPSDAEIKVFFQKLMNQIPNEQDLIEFKSDFAKHDSETDAFSMHSRDVVHGQEFHALAGVIRDNPFAYNLAFYGAIRQSIWMVGGALHVLMDSFGHSTFSAALGHANAGHAPDRPFQYWEKYEKMVNSVVHLMTHVRKLLPKEALDPNFILPGINKPSLDATAEEIDQAFIQNPDIKAVLARDILRSPEYTRYVVGSLMLSLYKLGAILDENEMARVASNSSLYNQGKDSYEIFSDLIEGYLRMPEVDRAQVFDLNIVRKNITGSISLGRRIEAVIADRSQIAGEKEKVIKEIASEIAETMLLTLVPTELKKERSFLVEKENIFRKLEMKLRIENLQGLIFKFVGQKVVFTADNPRKAMKEVLENASDMERAVKALNETEIVTLSKNEKLRWTWQMFRYYIVDLIQGLTIKNGFKTDWKQLLSWFGAKAGAHTQTDPRVVTLMSDTEFNKAVQDGVLKQIISGKYAKQIIKDHEDLQTQLRTEAAKFLQKQNLVSHLNNQSLIPVQCESAMRTK